jgi:hypothetical protein
MFTFKNNLLAVVLTALSTAACLAQDAKPAGTEQARTIQPSIMVIPFVREGQQMRTVLESDINLRVAIAKVKEGFDNRGFSTVDFRAKLQQLSNEKVIELENRNSLKQEVIELSGADIYVETEAKVNRSTESGNSVTVIVTAFDAFSGISLANKVSTSPKFFTENFERLTEKACEGLIEDFLNSLQAKFDEIVKNGRIATLSITFAESATADMDTELGEPKTMLSDLLETWLEKNTFKGYFHVQGVTATKMIVDEMRLPFRDESGRNYRVSKFAAELRNYLKTLGLESSRDLQGNKIFITIN